MRELVEQREALVERVGPGPHRDRPLLALRDAARTVTSLDRPLGEGEDAAFGDLLPSDAPAPESEASFFFAPGHAVVLADA